MNRKGDIPITILVIGVFAVCTLALLSFFASNISLRNSYIGIDKIEEANIYIEKGELDKLPLEVYEMRFPIDWRDDRLLFSISYEK